VVHLNELQEKYAEKGLVILAVSRESRASVSKFVEEFEVKYPTICETTDSMSAYECSGFPSSFLIDTGGRILWADHPGHLQASYLEEQIKEAHVLPAWPDALKDVHKAFRKDKFAEALAKAEKHVSSGKLEEEIQQSAEQIRDWFLWYGPARLEAAAADEGAGRYFQAFQAYEEVATLYKGHDLAKDAKAAKVALLTDKERKLEVKAGQKLEKILDAIRGESPKKQLKKLKPLRAKKYAETAAGKKARALAEELEKRL